MTSPKPFCWIRETLMDPVLVEHGGVDWSIEGPLENFIPVFSTAQLEAALEKQFVKGWNAAIEAAALKIQEAAIDRASGHKEGVTLQASWAEIRALKKESHE